MSRAELVRVMWDGAAFVPDGNRATALCHDQLGAGEVRLIDIDPERSPESHRHQFAFVRTAWENLPERHKGAFWATNPETLRKYALVRCGFCTASAVAVGTDKRAARVAASIKDAMAKGGGFVVVEASGPIVTIFTPESQRQKLMGRERFQASKAAIGEWLASLIGVPAEELMRAQRKVPA